MLLWQVEEKGDIAKEKRSWLLNESNVRVLEAVTFYAGAKNISETNYECVGSPSYFSRVPSITSIGNFYAPFGNLSPISERVDDSTQKLPAEKNSTNKNTSTLT